MKSGIRDSVKVSCAEIKCLVHIQMILQVIGFAETFKKPRAFNVTVKVLIEMICNVFCL